MTSPPDSIAELRSRIEQQQLELDSAMRGLYDAARRSISPARWVGEHPEIWLTSALVVGLWLGSRRRSPRRRGWR
jgi:hypothetical protein